MADDPNIIDNLARKIQKGQISEQVLMHFGALLDEMHDATDSKIYKILETGDRVNTDKLLSCLGEKKSYYEMKKRLRQHLNMGQSSGEQMKKELDKKEKGNARKEFSGYKGL